MIAKFKTDEITLLYPPLYSSSFIPTWHSVSPVFIIPRFHHMKAQICLYFYHSYHPYLSSNLNLHFLWIGYHIGLWFNP